MKKKIPIFKNEAAERAFWQKHDSTDYLDWSDAATPALPKLTTTTTTISLRLPEPLLEDLKRLANKRDVPYQSLLKTFLADRIESELRPAKKKRKTAVMPV
jgi:predicted DNA binding CopG/RHH family protein